VRRDRVHQSRRQAVVGLETQLLETRPDGSQPSLAINCEAAGVLCRLAVLHGRSDYRAAAVIRPDADYAGDAARILRSQRDTFREHGVTSAPYGLALLAYGEM
jgi:hypothetical protein